MTGQQLIDLIQRNGLEEFDLVVKFMDPTPTSEWGITLRTFEVDPQITDIGHSDKVAVLGIIEQ